MKRLKTFFLLAAGMLFITSCSDDDDAQFLIEEPTNLTGTMTLDITGLEALGDDFAYESWIIVDGAPVSAGIFNVEADGSLTEESFEIDAITLAAATAYVLTIEPNQDNDPTPSAVHILGGNFSGASADLNIEHPQAIGQSFDDATGGYIIATPTDGSLDTDEKSGIWFEEPTTDGPSQSLFLPTLPEGWEYEGWVVVDGKPLSTGKFLDGSIPDFAAPFSGGQPGPPYPGEDFLQNAPDGISFPLDLSGAITAITIEPVPDNSEAPFLLKPLIHTIPNPVTPLSFYEMDNGAAQTNPVGVATRN